ncbi:MAG: hypothetical protein H7067_13715 [Burkholderiales bacterium]|nr:hypothetical protein [Opitutaceae bacterium]
MPTPARLLFAALLTLASLARADSPQPDREISPLLVGTNVWSGQPDPQVWKYTEQARMRLIRIGGHAYDKKLPSEEVLIDWVKKIRAAGAEPLIQVSQYQPPETAAALVKLFNQRRAAGAPVRFWNIGNEPWLQAGRPDGYAGIPEKVAAYFKPTSAAMKAVDPSIKIFGPNECALFPQIYEPLFGGAHDITGKVPGKNYYYIDGLSWHRYPQTNNEPGLAEIADFHKSMVRARDIVDAANAKHRRRGDEALQWGIGEFNAKGGKQVHTFGNGQMFGAVYGLSALYGATYATSWSMFESSGNRGGTDFSAYDGGDFTPRASYWHQRLFAESFSGVTVAGAKTNRDDVLVFASRDKKAGRLAVMILNLSDSAEPLPYELRLGDTGARIDGLVLTVPLGARDTHRDTIAPRSSQFLVFEKSLLKKTVYTADDFAAGRAPRSSSASTPVRLPR